MPTFEFEQQALLRLMSDGCSKRVRIVGVDEVGRGCLAGPVVAAAVAFPREWLVGGPSESVALTLGAEDAALLAQVNDSKKVRPSKRKELSLWIERVARTSIAWATIEEIDQWNILRASMVAMRRALVGLQAVVPEFGAVLVDGHQNPLDKKFEVNGFDLGCGVARNETMFATLKTPIVQTLVGGDAKSLSIAAASIVAKVYRDEWMERLDVEFPGYAMGVHKGYATPVHRAALAERGPCPLHRKTFEPIKSMLLTERGVAQTATAGAAGAGVRRVP